MLFWIVAGTLAAIVAALLARPLLVPAPPAPEASPDQAIYRDQLAEVDRDLARGVLNPEEAERARVEIARRLLAADRAGPARFREAPRWLAICAASVAAVLVIMGGLGLYSVLGHPGAEDSPRAERLAQAQALRDSRPSQAEAEAAAREAFPPPEPQADPEYLAMIDELRRVVPTRGNDLQGWELLALHEARLGRYAEAARAQEQVVALKGEARTTAEDWLGLADRMVAAAGGTVTAEAEAALAEIARREPDNLGLLYYHGLLEAQTGRPDRAFPLWRRVVEEAPEGSLHRRLAQGQIADVAWLAGVDYELPAPGPSAEQMAAAAEMDPEAQQDMIRGMVDGLAARLASEGGPASDWARLVSALAVLGDMDQAAAVLAEARGVFAGDAGAEALLDEAAAEAGL